MNILDTLLGDQGSGATQQLGQQFGLDDAQVSSALGALVPAIAAGFQNNASNPQGLDGLMAALGTGRHQQYLDPSAIARPETTADGNGILGHIFGSKDVSRDVATQAAAQTGLDPALLKRLLPVVAAMVMGRMSQHVSSSPAMGTSGAQDQNPLGGLLGSLLEGGGAGSSGSGGSLFGDVAGLLGRLSGR